MDAPQEIAYTVTLKLVHQEGVISSARLLKARSKLPDDVMDRINKLFIDTFEQPKADLKTTVALGDLAEQIMMSKLMDISKHNSDFMVSDTSSCKDHGDIAIEYKDRRFCVEVKNYTKAIPGKEIDKYHRSLALPDYQAGVLFSMGDHGFAREYKLRSPIDVRMVDGKPSAYISGVDPEIMYPIVTMLMGMMTDRPADGDTALRLEAKIKALISINERSKEMRTLVEAQKKGLLKLEAMLSEVQALSLA